MNIHVVTRSTSLFRDGDLNYLGDSLIPRSHVYQQDICLLQSLVAQMRNRLQICTVLRVIFDYLLIGVTIVCP